ncbi:hypothetical protein [Haladaptatus sp. NG-SE-30]
MCHPRDSHYRTETKEPTIEGERESKNEREGLVARTKARLASLFETPDTHPPEPTTTVSDANERRVDAETSETDETEEEPIPADD